MELLALVGSGLADVHAGGPEQRLTPARGAGTERQHVMYPQSVTSSPALLRIGSQTHRNVATPLAQRAVAQDQRKDPCRAQPQRNANRCEKGPDHDRTIGTR